MLIFPKPQKYKAKVIEKQQLTKTVYLAKYQLLSPDTINFIAGQTMMITVAPGIFRAMSIASPPQEKTIITSVQDTAPGGPGSKWMTALKVGDDLELMAPLGRFVVDHDSPRKKVFVATGTGIAPFRSMLFDETDLRIPNEPISFYWGLRHKEDMYLFEEITIIDKLRDNLVFYFTLSQPPENEWDGLKGHVTGLVMSYEKDLINCDYYLCGNKKMILEMQEKLTAIGVPKDQLKFDPFY